MLENWDCGWERNCPTRWGLWPISILNILAMSRFHTSTLLIRVGASKEIRRIILALRRLGPTGKLILNEQLKN